MRCESCRGSIEHLKYASVRKWCSAECRRAGRRERARARFMRWRWASVPRRGPDLELALLGAAPIGAWFYRLSCPGLGNGSTRYFPSEKGWRLRPFEPPAVPWAGFYEVLFYGEDGQFVGEAAAVPVVPHRVAAIGTGNHRRELRPQPKPPRPPSVRRGAATSTGRPRPSTEPPRHEDMKEPPPPQIHHQTCAFCNDVHNCSPSARATQRSTHHTHLAPPGPARPAVEQRAEAPHRPAAPHRSPSQAAHRSPRWPHRRSSALRSPEQRDDLRRAAQPTAPYEVQTSPEQRGRDPSDRAPQDRPDG
jgi:hypothetical protein